MPIYHIIIPQPVITLTPKEITPVNNLLIINARIITLASEKYTNPRRGPAAMRDLGICENGFILIDAEQGIITAGGNMSDIRNDLIKSSQQVINANGRILLPGFIDCHTHACWAGSRLDEFQQKLEGTSYLDILKSGGGIMATVRDTRNASQQQLTDLTTKHLKRMLAFGTTCAEIKSGYGLNTTTELKMLRAIDQTQSNLPHITIKKTALIAHAVDPDQPDFFNTTITETLPAIAKEYPGITIDAYCEDGAWPLDQTRKLFTRAKSLNCNLRIHTDQFNSLGSTQLALELGATSVDHLEAVTDKDIPLIANSNTIAVALPASGFNTDNRYAPARKLIDQNAALAIATNYNPGSAPSPSIPFTLALACRKLNMTPAEAITAATINAACVLNLQNKLGSIEPAKLANLTIWDETDERALAYEFATTPPLAVIANGIIQILDESLKQ